MEPAEIIKHSKELGEKIEKGEIKVADLHPNVYYCGNGVFGFNQPTRLTDPKVVPANPPKFGEKVTGN